jgi:hypothetical protein
MEGCFATKPSPVNNPIPGIELQDWPTDPDTILALELTITEVGTVESINPLKTVVMEEDSLILRALYNWTFLPSILNGEPIKMRIIVVFRFSTVWGLCEGFELPSDRSATRSRLLPPVRCTPLAR